MERTRARALLPRRAASTAHRSRRSDRRAGGVGRQPIGNELGGPTEMKKILAALDNSLAGMPVLATAHALGDLLDAQVEAVHVRIGEDRTARNTAAASGFALRTLRGAVVDCLVEAGETDEVLAVVLGARGTPGGHRPLGATAASVATALLKPVVIVPPDARPPVAFRRILVPLEGSRSTSLAPRSLFELAGDAKVDVVALHVLEEDSIPLFTDQPQ